MGKYLQSSAPSSSLGIGSLLAGPMTAESNPVPGGYNASIARVSAEDTGVKDSFILDLDPAERYL